MYNFKLLESVAYCQNYAYYFIEKPASFFFDQSLFLFNQSVKKLTLFFFCSDELTKQNEARTKAIWSAALRGVQGQLKRNSEEDNTRGQGERILQVYKLAKMKYKSKEEEDPPGAQRGDRLLEVYRLAKAKQKAESTAM